MPRTKRREAGPTGAEAHIDAMIAEGLRCSRTRPAESLEIFSRALPLVDRRDSLRRCRLLAFSAACREMLSDFAAALEGNAAALRLARAAGSCEEEGRILFNTGICYHRMGRFTDALPMLIQALERRRELGDAKKTANTLASLGRCYMELGRFGEGIEALEEALRHAGETGDEAMTSGIRALSATIYCELHEALGNVPFRSDGMEHFRGAADICEAQILIAEGESQTEEGRYAEALATIEESLALSRSIGSRYGEAVALSILAETRRKLGDLDVAAGHCDEALAITARIGDIDCSPTLLETVAAIHRARGDNEGATAALLRALAITERGGNRRLQPGIHRQLSEVYEEMGGVEPAFHHYRAFVTARNEMLDYESKRAIEQVQNRLRLELLEKERRIVSMESERFDREVGHGIREIAAMTLNMGERNDPLYRFNRTLLTRFPKLTPAELRICSLIRGNMSTKEIADLLNVTTRNVETHRYHIRRKMNLPKNANLTNFLAAL